MTEIGYDKQDMYLLGMQIVSVCHSHCLCKEKWSRKLDNKFESLRKYKRPMNVDELKIACIMNIKQNVFYDVWQKQKTEGNGMLSKIPLDIVTYICNMVDFLDVAENDVFVISNIEVIFNPINYRSQCLNVQSV